MAGVAAIPAMASSGPRRSTPRASKTGDALFTADKRRITRLRTSLLHWYAENGRDLPWRRQGASTFEQVCVEVLLQRTRAEVVAGVYPEFFARFRAWRDIASASISELEGHFKPIGLWQRRARSIKGLATFAAERDGLFPATEQELAIVPGVGQYVANAILLFQHGKRFPLLDSNMARVLERYVRPRRLADIRYDPWLQSAAAWLVRDGDQATVNWATLDFASAVCAPRRPRCDRCLLASSCNYARSDRVPVEK